MNCRDVKTYLGDKECGSESDAEVIESQVDDQSHVHFSVDTSYKVKCEVKILICSLFLIFVKVIICVPLTFY